jgi:hypothetical protein
VVASYLYRSMINVWLMAKILITFCLLSQMFSGQAFAVRIGKYKIGDTGPGGGLIFFVDKDNRHKDFNYLEVTAEDVSKDTPWCDVSTQSIMLDRDWKAHGLGDGLKNTDEMLKHCEAGAAREADSYVSSTGKDDWYLPSRGELKLIYAELAHLGKGGFDEFLWSSSEFDATLAFYHDFRTSDNGMDFKDHGWSVRAVRKF